MFNIGKDYIFLSKVYNPSRADEVKNLFRNDASKEDIVKYLYTWAQLFFKHPWTCIEASIANYYQYFYPGEVQFELNSIIKSSKYMNKTNSYMQDLDSSLFAHPNFTYKIASYYQKLQEYVMRLPIISVLSCPAIYTWIVLLAVFFCFDDKNLLSYWILPFVTMVLLLFGPTNGYYGRYQFPIIISLPFLLLSFLNRSSNKD